MARAGYWRFAAIRSQLRVWGERGPWFEPYGGDPTWRQEMWGAIVALHGRYPRALSNLKDDWWTDEQHTETLCALATWRSELDDSGADPREELAFQTQLNDYAHTLQRESAGVTRHGHPEFHQTSGVDDLHG